MIEQIKMMLDEKNRIMDERTREELEFDTFKQEVEGYYENTVSKCLNTYSLTLSCI